MSLKSPIIGTESGIRVGLVVSLLALGAAWVWWAATISTKLDTIMVQQAAQALQQSKLSGDVEELKTWRKLVDTIGSGPVAGIGDRLRSLEKQVEMHEALDNKRFAKPNPVK